MTKLAANMNAFDDAADDTLYDVNFVPMDAPPRDGVAWESVDEGKKLVLAQWCLGVLAGVFFVAMLCAIVLPDSGGSVFEAIQKVIPPFATLIIGYYFARNNN